MEYIQQRMHFLISYFATGLDLLFKSCGERIFVKSNEIEEFFDFSQNLKIFYFSKIIAPHARIIQYLSPILMSFYQLASAIIWYIDNRKIG